MSEKVVCEFVGLYPTREDLPDPKPGMVALDSTRTKDNSTYIWVVHRGVWIDESVLFVPKERCRCGCHSGL